MSSSWGHDPGALGILAEAVGSEYTAQSVLNEVAEDGWALLHRSVSPSVRLARWLDADPGHTVETIRTIEPDPGRQWMCDLTFGADQQHRVWSWGATRAEALSAALDQAEGVEHG